MRYLVGGKFITCRLVYYDHEAIVHFCRIGNAGDEWPHLVGNVLIVIVCIWVPTVLKIKVGKTVDFPISNSNFISINKLLDSGISMPASQPHAGSDSTLRPSGGIFLWGNFYSSIH